MPEIDPEPWLTAFAAITALMAGTAQPAEAQFFDGNQLYNACQTTNTALFCGGYVAGASDTFDWAVEGVVCAPSNVTTGQEGDIVTKFLREHPEQRQYSGSAIVLAAKCCFPMPSRKKVMPPSGQTRCFFAIAIVVMTTGCSFYGWVSDDEVFTLYRSSSVLENARIHIATFDAADGRKYNSTNCETARQDFQDTVPNIQLPGFAHVRYWCELGRYKP